MNKNFKIIIPFYNVEAWVDKCVKSVQLQTYENFKCFLVDDMSTDFSTEVIKNLISDDERFVLIENKEKKYALKNIYEAIQESGTDTEDIIVTLDGDDWFATKRTLETLREIYDETNCLMTYGSYIEYPSKVKGKFCREIPANIIRDNTYRESQWFSSHLRTFKRGLWDKIDPNDLKQDGEFFRMTWDMAFMFPMLEMAGPLAVHVEKMLYSYNRQNPLNDDKVNHRLQLKTESLIRQKDKYSEDFLSCEILGPGQANSGLGNQLFCVANALSYSKESGKKAVFPQVLVDPSIKKYKEIFYSKLNFGRNINIYQKSFNEKDFNYSKIPNIDGNTYLRGYFQSHKYFDHNRDYILDKLNIINLKEKIQKQYGDHSDFISIHVRRCDYLNLQEYHGLLDLKYYKKCIDFFGEKEKYIIFSDDIEWCKNKFKFIEDIHFSPCEDDWEDLILMSSCKKHIVANSSFSWWAAWISGKEALAPKKWFGKANNLDSKDLIPNTWRII